MKTTSFRLSEKELERIEKLAREGGESKSETVRELLDHGWEYLMLKEYKKGNFSLSRLSQRLDKPLVEVIDLLAELGIESPLEKADVMEGLKELTEEY